MAAFCWREFSGPFIQFLGPAILSACGREKTSAAFSTHEHNVMACGCPLRKAVSHRFVTSFPRLVRSATRHWSALFRVLLTQ